MIRSYINENLPTHIKAIDLYSKLSTKKDEFILFGSMNGEYYGDNSMHLFEWTLKNRPDLNPVWLTRSDSVLQKLRTENKPVRSVYSRSGIQSLYTSRVGVFSNSLYDLAVHPVLVPKSMNLIALRHGRSVKRIRFARKDHSISERERQQRKKESQLIRYAISTSEFISELQEECLKIGEHKHVVTGYPRNRDLISPSTQKKDEWNRFLGYKDPSKVILYAPTWRHGREPTQFFPFEDYDIPKLNKVLIENQVTILLRPHANELNMFQSVRSQIDKLEQESEHIKLATHEEFADVNSILPFIDGLITDYSAIYHDFLLLNKPILFIPYDYDEFKKQNGFLYDYLANLPGPQIDTFSDFVHHINNMSNGIDEYAKQRNYLREKVHQYDDGNACSRVIELVDELRKEC